MFSFRCLLYIYMEMKSRQLDVCVGLLNEFQIRDRNLRVIKMLACTFSCSVVWLFANPWTVACQAPLFMGFPRQDSCIEKIKAIWGELPQTPTAISTCICAHKFCLFWYSHNELFILLSKAGLFICPLDDILFLLLKVIVPKFSSLFYHKHLPL